MTSVCSHCLADVSPEAATCPVCGQPSPGKRTTQQVLLGHIMEEGRKRAGAPDEGGWLDHWEKIWEPFLPVFTVIGTCYGVYEGALLGFEAAGVGGAILCGLIGGVIFFVLAAFVYLVIGLAWAFIPLFAALYFGAWFIRFFFEVLWGLGKP